MNGFPSPLKEQIGRGGFATVFRDPRNPKITCIKQFKDPVIGNKVAQLQQLAGLDTWARPSEAQHIKESFSWPLELFGDDKQILGYTMPLAPADAFITLRAAGKESQKLLEISFLTVKNYFNKAAITSNAPEFSDQDRIELSIAICDTITSLHEYGLVYRDVSARNMTARLTEPRRAFVLDADSITTIDAARTDFIVSPGWQVEAGFDPLQTDRAKLALLVLRLLVQDNDARPPVGLDVLERSGRKVVADAISRVYTEATKESMDDLLGVLRRARSADRNRRAWNDALDSGFARRVVREANAASSAADLETLARAKAHVEAEKEIEAAELKMQRKLIARLQRTSNFVIDTLPTVGMVPAPRSAAELEQLAFDSQFIDIAMHLVQSGLPHLADHPIIPSIADRAAFEADRPKISAVTKPGVASLRIQWPHSFYCNAIEISIDSGVGAVTREMVVRDKMGTPSEREVRLPAGGKVRVDLRPGIRTPQDGVLLSRTALVSHDIDIPPTPKPPPPPISRKNVAMGQALIVDLEEEERLREEAERARKRRKRNRILAVIALLAIGGGAYATWRAMQPPILPPASPTFVHRY
ncbi:MAG: hypothetical protein RL430_1539 [Actinomycetota bacterium]